MNPYSVCHPFSSSDRRRQVRKEQREILEGVKKQCKKMKSKVSWYKGDCAGAVA